MQQQSLTPWYLVAVLGTLAIVIGSLTAMKIAHVEIDQLFVGIVSATVVPTLVSLLGTLRGMANGQQLEIVQQAAAEAAAKATVAKDVVVKSHNELVLNTKVTEQIRDAVVKQDG